MSDLPMDDLGARFVADLVGRLHGPMTLRFMLQPLTAIIAATRDGMKDSRENKPPYFWTIFSQPDARRALLREGWKSVARTIAIGSVMDAVYQVIVFRWIHPLELVVVVLGLAFVPYVLWRGPVNRIARRWTMRKVQPV
jgi:hypothetical protein